MRLFARRCLELTYTAHDMVPFAYDMGHIDEKGEVKPPFTWDEVQAPASCALGSTPCSSISTVSQTATTSAISTRPSPSSNVKKKPSYGGVYRSCELCLAWMNALAAGDPDAEIYL